VRRPAPYLFPLGTRLGEHNLVLHATARRHSIDSYAGPLSIKTVLRGRVTWVVAGRDLIVDLSSFLVLAAGERYSMKIDEPKPVETCCAFFAKGFLEQIAADLTSPLQTALDAPERTAPSLAYLSALHGDRERALTGRVCTLTKRCEKALNPSGAEEDFLALGVSLLEYYEQIRAQAARLPAVRSSTRQELFRRLLIGREYIHSHGSDPISLANVARAACLSPFHFHRGFTRAFQQTPHSYLTQLRLARARDMIASGSSVLEACIAVGFSSPSAFSRLFRQRLGYAPSAARREFARSGKKAAPISNIVVT
jgi:AraC-like DNA-binding protein